MEKLTIEAKSVAAFVDYLDTFDYSQRANITATENGQPWATVTIHEAYGSTRSIFPNYLGTTATGDESKRGQCGARWQYINRQESRHALSVVVNRARKMV